MGARCELARRPNGTVLGTVQNAIVSVGNSSARTYIGFNQGTVTDAGGVFAPEDVAVGPNGVVYSDTIANNGWSRTTAIVAIGPTLKISTLWAKNEPTGYQSK